MICWTVTDDIRLKDCRKAINKAKKAKKEDKPEDKPLDDWMLPLFNKEKIVLE